MHHGEQSSLRDHVDATSRSHAINSIVNGPGGPGGPGGGPLNIHGVKVIARKHWKFLNLDLNKNFAS